MPEELDPEKKPKGARSAPFYGDRSQLATLARSSIAKSASQAAIAESVEEQQ